MATTIALIGRANVGKSTLFNLLCQTNKAIVANKAGTTRDRQYGMVKRYVQNAFNLVDTGGISDSDDSIEKQTKLQANIAVDEAQILFFVCDATFGVHIEDELIAKQLRTLKTKKDIYLLINKCDGLNLDYALSDFFKLGLGQPIAISAISRLNINHLMGKIDQKYPANQNDEGDKSIKIAVIGKPNAGKSTFINQIIKNNRLITSEVAGTSRDSIEVPFEYEDQRYIFIDTAGIRRRAKIKENLEKLTIIKAMGAMQNADVVLILIDANELTTAQDLRLMELAIESNKPLLIVVNKCDNLNKNLMQKLKMNLELKMHFLNWVEVRYISALKGFGMQGILKKINLLFDKANSTIVTSKLCQILEQINDQHPSVKIKNKVVKFRYAHQGGKNPIIIVLHGNHDKALPQHYLSFLINSFRKKLDLIGIPIQLQFRKSENPYKDKKNQLNNRQINKRKRLIHFAKRKK